MGMSKSLGQIAFDAWMEEARKEFPASVVADVWNEAHIQEMCQRIADAVTRAVLERVGVEMPASTTYLEDLPTPDSHKAELERARDEGHVEGYNDAEQEREPGM